MKTPNFYLLSFVLALAPACAKPPQSSHELYAAVAMTGAQKNSSTPTDSGLYRLHSDGSWQPFGPRVLGVNSVAVQPGSDGRVMLVASGDGVLRSTDAGQSWRLTTGWDVMDVRTFAVNPSNPNEFYASTCWGPLRSTDGGATWQHAQAGLNLLFCQTVVADSQTPGRVLLGTEDGIYLSTNGAKTWSRTDSPPATALRMVQSGVNPQLMLAGTQGRGVWLSRDAGETWMPTDSGSAENNLYAAALDGHSAANMAVGGWGAGVRVSADGGKTWSDRSAGLPTKNIFVLAFDPDVANRLWVSTFEKGFYRSDDLGKTWQESGLMGSYGFDFVFVQSSN
ncbi:MAG: hypothetical protein CMI16_09025 [Opitutaceae bacterium]|nr:hypothetical protein [Opitutaceae bacterium]|tara:strand:+ start:6527 stop:7537 length:1011 start_codon:yes stop_codon:yes gene_type:complete